MKAIKGKCKELTSKFNWIITMAISVLIGFVVAVVVCGIIELFKPKKPKDSTKETVSIPLTDPLFGVTPNDVLSDVRAIQQVINTAATITAVNPHLEIVINVHPGSYVIDSSMNGREQIFNFEPQAVFNIRREHEPITFYGFVFHYSTTCFNIGPTGTELTLYNNVLQKNSKQ